ncbi:MAG TPA: FAD-binding oxidoreductase [Iamia sp.]|nr:FAD-binding oxidoreductase [Iamia sp.]
MAAPLAPGYREDVLWHDAAPLDATGDGPPPAGADVVVVGAGYCGLMAAAELARRGRSVAVLDRGPLGVGASTRNGGMVLPELKAGPGGLERAHGDLGRRMFAAVDEAFDLVEALTTGPDGIACDYARTGRLELASGATSAAALRAAADELEAVGHGARYVTGDDLAAEIGSTAYPAGLVVERSGGLHPARFHAGLVARARAAGATLHPGCRVTAVGADGVETATGAVRGGDVLVAVNGHPDGAVPDLRRRILPMGSFVVATEPLAPEVRDAVLPTGRMAYDTRNLLSYWRLDADGRMVFGGRRSLGPTTVAEAREVLRARMVHVHPQLADARIERAWGGDVAITRDRLPHCGRMDGAWYAAGCNGSGVALNAWLGLRMAAAIDGEELPPFAELAHPRVPPVRRAWLPVVSTALRAQDHLDRLRPVTP